MSRSPRILIDVEILSEIEIRILKGLTEYSHLYGSWRFFNARWGVFCSYYNRKRKNFVSLIKDLKPNLIITRIWENKQVRKYLSYGLPIINFMPLQTEPSFTKPHPSFVIFERDAAKVAEMGAEYLLGLGLRTFAYFDCSYATFSCKKRIECFTKRITKAGFKTYTYKPSAGSVFLEQHNIINWLKSLPKPLGIMTCGDYEAVDVSTACRFAGLRVPEDISILTTGNELACRLATPTLSSINLNFEKAGYEVGEVIEKILSGKKKNFVKSIKVNPTDVIKRQSTSLFAVEDGVVLDAIHFIQSKANAMLQVSEVADAMAVSRQFLNRRFKQTIGKTIRDIIRQVHAQQISQMLLETNMSLEKIASVLNYSSPRYINRIFYKEKGMTPHAYRKKYSWI